MENLLEIIQQDLVSAQKTKDEVAISTLRLLLSEIKNAQIAKGKELTTKEIAGVVQKNAKKHKESIEAYKKAQRSDLVEKEEAELKVLKKYLPEQISKAEIEKVVDEVISASGANGMQDMGKVMGQVMGKLKGQADGGLVSEVVKSKLIS